MTGSRRISKWTSIGLLVAGSVIAFIPLYLGYAPRSVPEYLGLNFSMWWGGIAIAVSGVAVMLRQFTMEELPPKPRKTMEISA